jgi:hypothetical protein
MLDETTEGDIHKMIDLLHDTNVKLYLCQIDDYVPYYRDGLRRVQDFLLSLINEGHVSD